MVQPIMKCYINKVGQSTLLVVVIKTELGACQIESRLLDMSLCSVEGLSHGAAESKSLLLYQQPKVEHVALSAAVQECMWLRQLEA